MKNRKFVYVAASVAVWCVALTGCQTVQQDVDLPQSSLDSGTKTPKPSPTKTTVSYERATADGPAKNVPMPKFPKEAGQNSAGGAEAFVDYYFELVNYVIQTNDTERIKSVTTRGCAVCALSIIDPADKAQREGRWQVGGLHHAKIIDSEISGKNLAIVTVSYTADASKFFVKANEVESKLEKLPPTTVAIGLEFDGKWRVYTIEGDD